MQDELLQTVQGDGDIAVRIAAVYVASLVALRFAGRRIQSHLRPIDLTAVALMAGVVSLDLEAKGLAQKLVVIATMSVCARATSWVAAATRGFEEVRGTQPGLALDHALSPPQPGEPHPSAMPMSAPQPLRWQPSLAKN